jgi:hypothetical protein
MSTRFAIRRERERVLEAQRIVEHQQALEVAASACQQALRTSEGPTVVTVAVVTAYRAERARLKGLRELTFETMWVTMPEWVRELTRDVSRIYGIPVKAICLKHVTNAQHTRAQHVAARHHLWSRIRHRGNGTPPSFPRIGSWFGVDHTSVMYGVNKHRSRSRFVDDPVASARAERKREVSRDRYRRLKETST